MKLLFAFGILLTSTAYAEDMRFAIEHSCISSGAGLTFKCDMKNGEFVITKSGTQFSGTHPDGGPKQSLSVVKSSPHIIILNYPVSFDGSSTVHLTDNLSRVYWVSIAFSTQTREREVSVVSGRRIK